MEYEYPLNEDWTIEETIDVVAFYNVVEQAYENGVSSEQVLKAYHAFKQIVKSIMEEKQLDKAFKEVSTYSLYEVVKQSKLSTFVKLG